MAWSVINCYVPVVVRVRACVCVRGRGDENGLSVSCFWWLCLYKIVWIWWLAGWQLFPMLSSCVTCPCVRACECVCVSLEIVKQKFRFTILSWYSTGHIYMGEERWWRSARISVRRVIRTQWCLCMWDISFISQQHTDEHIIIDDSIHITIYL